MAQTIFFYVLIIVLFSLSSSQSLKFQVFKDFNQRGLIYDFRDEVVPGETLRCVDIPTYGRGIAGSINTDFCLMAYSGLKCTGNSVKLLPGDKKALRLSHQISSFHQCNKTHGGETIHAEVFTRNQELIAKYLDVCACQDIPTQVSSKFARMDNFGNCITVYSTENCGGSSLDVDAGRNAVSDNLDNLDFYIRSFKACGMHPACIKLNAKVTKFVLDFGEFDPSATKEVELAAKTTFYNNGSATVTQVYEASKTIRESCTITRSEALTQMHSASVTVGASTEFSAKFFGTGTKVTASLELGYTYENTREKRTDTTFTDEKESTFSIRQEIQIPPCVEYEVSSMVSIIENAKITYWIYTKISGEYSGRKLTAEEIKFQVEDMIFVEDYDEHTVLYKTKNVLFANLGVDTWITGEGSDIVPCQSGSKPENQQKYPLLFSQGN